jgi:hypothetical protein
VSVRFAYSDVLAMQKDYPINLELPTPDDCWDGEGWPSRRHKWATARAQTLLDSGLDYRDFRYWFHIPTKTVNFQFKQKKHAALFKLMWGGRG